MKVAGGECEGVGRGHKLFCHLSGGFEKKVSGETGLAVKILVTQMKVFPSPT